MKSFSFWSFGWACLDRAVTDTAKFFGWNLRTVITPIILLAFGYWLHYRIKGLSATKEEVLKFLIVTAAPLAVSFVGLIAYHIVRSPYLVYTDERTSAEMAMSGIEGRVAQAQKEKATAVDEVESLKEKLAEANRRTHAPVPDVASGANAAREKRKQDRATIAQMMERGVAIRQSCMTKEEKPELDKEAGTWANQTYSLLKGMDESYSARFNSASGFSYSHDGVPKNNDNVWNFLNIKLQALSEIVSEMRD